MGDRDQLSPREVAKLTGFSYHAILRAIKRGDLRACEPIPGRYRIEVDEYERWRKAPARTDPTPGAPPRRRRGKQGTSRGSYASELRAIEGEAA